MPHRILLLNGPNLNLLGTREPTIYGSETLAMIVEGLQVHGAGHDVEIRDLQANGEGALIDALHDARDWADGVIFNPAGYSHTSIALRDAVSAIELPVVEIHLSNVHGREPFRHRSMLSPVCVGVIAGFGSAGYRLALDGLLHHLANR